MGKFKNLKEIPHTNPTFNSASVQNPTKKSLPSPYESLQKPEVPPAPSSTETKRRSKVDRQQAKETGEKKVTKTGSKKSFHTKDYKLKSVGSGKNKYLNKVSGKVTSAQHDNAIRNRQLRRDRMFQDEDAKDEQESSENEYSSEMKSEKGAEFSHEEITQKITDKLQLKPEKFSKIKSKLEAMNTEVNTLEEKIKAEFEKSEEQIQNEIKKCKVQDDEGNASSEGDDDDYDEEKPKRKKLEDSVEEEKEFNAEDISDEYTPSGFVNISHQSARGAQTFNTTDIDFDKIEGLFEKILTDFRILAEKVDKLKLYDDLSQMYEQEKVALKDEEKKEITPKVQSFSNQINVEFSSSKEKEIFYGLNTLLSMMQQKSQIIERSSSMNNYSLKQVLPLYMTKIEEIGTNLQKYLQNLHEQTHVNPPSQKGPYEIGLTESVYEDDEDDRIEEGVKDHIGDVMNKSVTGTSQEIKKRLEKEIDDCEQRIKSTTQEILFELNDIKQYISKSSKFDEFTESINENYKILRGSYNRDVQLETETIKALRQHISQIRKIYEKTQSPKQPIYSPSAPQISHKTLSKPNPKSSSKSPKPSPNPSTNILPILTSLKSKILSHLSTFTSELSPTLSKASSSLTKLSSKSQSQSTEIPTLLSQLTAKLQEVSENVDDKESQMSEMEEKHEGEIGELQEKVESLEKYKGDLEHTLRQFEQYTQKLLEHVNIRDDRIDELTQVDKNNRRLIDQATDDIQDLHNVIQVYQHRDKKL